MSADDKNPLTITGREIWLMKHSMGQELLLAIDRLNKGEIVEATVAAASAADYGRLIIDKEKRGGGG